MRPLANAARVALPESRTRIVFGVPAGLAPPPAAAPPAAPPTPATALTSAPPKLGMRPVAEMTWAGAVSVQVSVPAARFGTPATFRPSSSVHAIWEPSGENVA